MSVQSSPVVHAPGPPMAIPVPFDPEASAAYDARWNAWIERARQQDRATHRKLRIAAPAVAAVLLGALAFGLAAGAR